MDKVHYIILLIIISIGLFLFVNKSKETVTLEKRLLEIPTKKPLKKINSNKVSKTDDILNSEISNDEFYNKFSYSDKLHYFSTCFEVTKDENSNEVIKAKNIDDEINYYIKSKEKSNIQLTELQLSHLKKMYDNCISLLEFKYNIIEEINSVSYRDEDNYSDFSHEVMQLHTNQGIEVAIKFAENNLLSSTGDKSNKYDALAFLFMNTGGDWLNSVNDNLNLSLNPSESRMHINTALNIMECEYGLQDCGGNSLMMYNNCLTVSEVCGMDGLQFFRFINSGLESSYVESYISYFKKLYFSR